MTPAELRQQARDFFQVQAAGWPERLLIWFFSYPTVVALDQEAP